MEKIYSKTVGYLIFVFWSFLLLTSCQRSLTSHVSSANETEPNNNKSLPLNGTLLTDDEAVEIDTLYYSLHRRISALHSNNIYVDRKVQSKTNEFYKRNNFRTKWFGIKAPSSLYYTFSEIIKTCDRYGLRPVDYPIISIEKRLQSVYSDSVQSKTKLYELDLYFTDVVFLFTTHLIEGRITNAGDGEKIWKRQTICKDDLSVLLTSHDPE